MTTEDWFKSEYSKCFSDIDDVPDWCVSVYWTDPATFRDPTWIDDEFARGTVFNRGSARWETRTMPRSQLPAYREGSRWYRKRRAA
jgi:hypothetical protein